MVQAVIKKSHGPKKAKKALTFTIDCTKPVEDKIMEIASFEKFLQDRIKVDGKTGLLGDNVKVSRTKSSVTVTSEIAMSKRYLKYLTKKVCVGVSWRGPGGPLFLQTEEILLMWDMHACMHARSHATGRWMQCCTCKAPAWSRPGPIPGNPWCAH